MSQFVLSYQPKSLSFRLIKPQLFTANLKHMHKCAKRLQKEAIV